MACVTIFSVNKAVWLQPSGGVRYDLILKAVLHASVKNPHPEGILD